MLKVFSVQNMQHAFETLWQKVQFSKDVRTYGAHILIIHNYFYEKFV